jgi:hypothetical protein
LHDRSRPGWHLYLLTVTAPGDDPEHRRWRMEGLPLWTPRPVCGCSHSKTSIARWNGEAGQVWNRLRTSLRREHPGLEFIRLAELQKRGAIHHHVVVASLQLLDPAEVQRLAIGAGYGCVVDLDPIRDVRAAAAYVSKYATKDLGATDGIPWERDLVDHGTGEVYLSTRPTCRQVSRSADWFLTMKAIKSILRERANRDRLAADWTPLRGPGADTQPTAEPLAPQALSPP